METGRITVRVYTSEAEIPLTNAVVTIYQMNGDGEREIIGVRNTNANGETSAIEIETPNKSDSETPNNNNTVPFAICNIKVDHLRYGTIIIKNVQIFSGVRTMQNVEMIPLKENSTPQEESQEFDVTPQEL